VLILRLTPRMLLGLGGLESLLCSCDSRPDLFQPDSENQTALLGVCPVCRTWTLFVDVSGDWSTVEATELPVTDGDALRAGMDSSLIVHAGRQL
jgi:hypothetical protein